jgi:hypothetical protein
LDGDVAVTVGRIVQSPVFNATPVPDEVEMTAAAASRHSIAACIDTAADVRAYAENVYCVDAATAAHVASTVEVDVCNATPRPVEPNAVTVSHCNDRDRVRACVVTDETVPWVRVLHPVTSSSASVPELWFAVRRFRRVGSMNRYGPGSSNSASSTPYCSVVRSVGSFSENVRR